MPVTNEVNAFARSCFMSANYRICGRQRPVIHLIGVRVFAPQADDSPGVYAELVR